MASFWLRTLHSQILPVQPGPGCGHGLKEPKPELSALNPIRIRSSERRLIERFQHRRRTYILLQPSIPRFFWQHFHIQSSASCALLFPLFGRERFQGYGRRMRACRRDAQGGEGGVECGAALATGTPMGRSPIAASDMKRCRPERAGDFRT